MNIIKHKRIFFIISLAVIIPGVISLLLWGMRLSIDFTGGSNLTFSFSSHLTQSKLAMVKRTFLENHDEIGSIALYGNNLLVRTGILDQKHHASLLTDLHNKIPDITEGSFETVGPTIGSETLLNALKAIVLASILIVLYIAWSFRSIPKPASSWRFGICAIVALLHDVLVVLGVFSLLGHFLQVEVDSLFVTALLTVIGFSVHDTIVVFDRIRENLRRERAPFAEIVNDSILQTLSRSLNTSLTVILVLFALLLFGGASTTWFIAALLIGVVSGTYSSIFNASPLLVLWHERRGEH